MNMHMNTEGMEVNTNVYYAMDKPNRRIYSKTETMGMNIIMILNKGEFLVKMLMPDGSSMAMPAAPGMEEQLENMFNQVFDQSDLLKEYTIISCDGPVTIGDIVSGEQITVKAKIANYDPANGEEIQDKEKELKVIVQKNNPNRFVYIMDQEAMGQILAVMEKTETTKEGFPKKMSMTMYTVDGDSYKLFSTMDYEFTNINQPLDESLFSLE